MGSGGGDASESKLVISQSLHTALKVLFLVYVICLLFLLVRVTATGISIETDIQAIVPQNDAPAVKIANETLNARFGDTIVFAVLSADKNALKESTLELTEGLTRNELLKVRSDEEFYGSYQALIDLYRPYRFSLLSRTDRELLLSGKENELVDSAWRKLLGFRPANIVGSFADDPLGVFENYWSALPIMKSGSGIDIEGYIDIESDGGQREYAKVIVLEINGGALDMSLQSELVGYLNDLQRAVKNKFENIEIYRTGLLFHAQYAASKAKKEFTLISIVSLIGIITLFLFCFRSLRPLFLSVASLVFGFSSAVVICSTIFKELHLFTLVFGASLIGVVVDYSVHYFSHSKFAKKLDRLAVLKKIFPSICMGLVTTVAGFTCLYQASLPGLREIATFCVLGLMSAWLFVVVVFPQIAGAKSKPFPDVVYRIARLPERMWLLIGNRMSRVFVVIFFVCSILVGFFAGESLHDIRLLYKPPDELIKSDLKIGSIFPEQASNQYLSVSGKDAQAVLGTEERLLVELDELIASGGLEGYSAISQYVPSYVKQKDNYRIVSDTIYSDSGELDRFIAQAGIDDGLKEKFKQSHHNAASNYLSISEFLSSAPDEIGMRWMGEHDGIYYSIITLSGIHSIEALSEIASKYNGVSFVDRIRMLSGSLFQLFKQAIVLLVLAYGIVALVLLLRYKHLASLSILFIPLLSLSIVLALYAIFSVSVGLFHILALYLALGLGLDYGIFLYDSNASDEAKIAVLLSVLTSSLSFGMLSLSSTPMISAFGLTILLSGLLSLIIAPLSIAFGRSLVQQK